MTQLATGAADERVAEVSIRSLAASLGLAKDTVARAVRRLRDLGVIQAEQCRSDRGLAQTSTCFEGATGPSARFESRAFGYSRDQRSDRPQIVIGLLCTGDGVPIATACGPATPGQRAVVVRSTTRRRRDLARTAELIERCETKLLRLEHRVDRGDLVDAGKIGRAAQRILGRLFDVEIAHGRFRYHYSEPAIAYEGALAGHYVLVTDLSPSEATATKVAAMWHQLRAIEARFRTRRAGGVSLSTRLPSRSRRLPHRCATLRPFD
jgi:DNA-binding Lrp family transcriptional regulator